MAKGVFGGDCVEHHTVYVYDRGGVTRVGQLIDVSEVMWKRDRDGVSEANIFILGAACSAQAEILSNIEPKRSEIVIFRGAERVWEGPVWRVGWHSDRVEINAHDVMAYVNATPMTQAYQSAVEGESDTVIARIERIMAAEMGVWEVLDPPANVMPHVVAHHSPNEAKTASRSIPFEMTVGEQIQQFARQSGIDYTVIGRAIHFWDTSRSLGQTRTLTEHDFFSEVVITAYGADMTSAVYVIGADGLYGYAAEESPYYGPWTTILTAWNEEGTAEPGQEELDGQAKRNLSGRMPVPVEVRVPDNSGIRLNETLTIHDMVPGVHVLLLATLNSRRMSQMQKIDLVTVTETSEGETVQVTLTPASKEDSDDIEPPEL
jgi:hypothetical protein